LNCAVISTRSGIAMDGNSAAISMGCALLAAGFTGATGVACGYLDIR
jgi:hypothetical protein